MTPRAAALVLVLAAAGPLSPRIAGAQASAGDVLSFLLTNQAVQTSDFEKDVEAAAVTRDTITRLLLVELATVPISSSSAGFTYRLNPLLGTVERASASFGPFFTERALTAGRGQASFGVSFQTARYSRLDGNELRDGTFITTANRFRDEAEPFQREALTLRLESRALTFLANVGVTDRLDIGAAVPLVFLSLDGQRVNTYRGQTFLQASGSADASGFGDVALRAKYRVFGDGASGLAVTGEARLPTGREEDLLGTGEASVKTLVIASVDPGGPVAASGNVGWTAGGLVDQFHFAGAVTAAASPQFTLVGEVVGRRIQDIGRIAASYAPHPAIEGVDTLRLLALDEGTTSAYAVAGFKWNVGATWLVSGNVLLPLTNRGLRADVVPVFAIDYAFGR